MDRYLVPKGKRIKLKIDAAFKAGSYFVVCKTCWRLGPWHIHKGRKALRPSERRRLPQRGD